MGYARQIATAQRLIAAKGQACIWRKPAALDGSADPWRDIRSGNPTDADCAIAWFSPRDVQRGREEFLSSVAGKTIDVPVGHEIGLMAATDFVPLVGDTIVKGTDPDGAETSVVSIDQIGPDGTPIMYFVKVKL